jgi:hypothetical protein
MLMMMGTLSSLSAWVALGRAMAKVRGIITVAVSRKMIRMTSTMSTKGVMLISLMGPCW